MAVLKHERNLLTAATLVVQEHQVLHLLILAPEAIPAAAPKLRRLLVVILACPVEILKRLLLVVQAICQRLLLVEQQVLLTATPLAAQLYQALHLLTQALQVIPMVRLKLPRLLLVTLLTLVAPLIPALQLPLALQVQVGKNSPAQMESRSSLRFA
jgi:hypothetical protein